MTALNPLNVSDSLVLRKPARIPWRLVLPVALLAILFLAYILVHPRGIAVASVTPWANQGVCLALVAVAQFYVVVTRGVDLSVGAILALSDAVASTQVNGSALHIVAGVGLVLLVGVACGLFNGIVVVFGRVESIVATLATSALFSGLALVLRPVPGGEIAESMSDLFTYETLSVIPTSLILLLAIMCLVWWPLSRTVSGRALYAVGSNESAAFMSGLDPGRSRLLAHVLAGFFAACGGLFLAFQTLSGDASVGFSYTLNSIAAVVVGGASLAGGVGTVVGVIAGAYILRTIGSIMIFSGLQPMTQPLFEGLVLIAAVSVGAVEVVRARNKMDVMR